MVGSTLSLVDEWAVGFPSVAILFYFLSAAVGLCSTVFLVGMSVWCTGPSEYRVCPMAYDGVSVVRSDRCFHLHSR